MRKILASFLAAGLAFLLAGCQGFFDDYSYQPVGSNVSSNSY